MCVGAVSIDNSVVHAEWVAHISKRQCEFYVINASCRADDSTGFLRCFGVVCNVRVVYRWDGRSISISVWGEEGIPEVALHKVRIYFELPCNKVLV